MSVGGRSVSLSNPFGDQAPVPSKRFFGEVGDHPKSTSNTTTTYRASYGQQQRRSGGESSTSPRSHSQQDQRSLSEAMVTLPPPNMSFQHAGMTITHHPHNRNTPTTNTNLGTVTANERSVPTAMAGSRLFSEKASAPPPPPPARRVTPRILTSPAFEETNENITTPSSTTSYNQPATSLLGCLPKSTTTPSAAPLSSSSSHQPPRGMTTASGQYLLPAATSGWGDQNISMSYAIRQRDALRPQTLNQKRNATTTATESEGISSALSGTASGSVPRRRGDHRTIYAPF